MVGEPKEARVEDLAHFLRVARGASRWKSNPVKPDDDECAGSVFLIGAGCSRSADIPIAADIARECAVELCELLSSNKRRFKKPDTALKWLQKERHLSPDKNWSEYYIEIFDRHFVVDQKQREIIQKAIAKGQGKINWAHVCLGELVDEHFVHTVLTTNFDQLALKGIVLAGRIPLVADGIEAVNRVSPRPSIPQLVHVHGSMHTYSPRNSTHALKAAALDPMLLHAMLGLLQGGAPLVVVGYAGGEDAVIQNLKAAVAGNPNLPIFWVLYGNSISDLREEVREVLSGPNKFYIPGQDADAFFSDLMRILTLQPAWISSPLASVHARMGEVAHSKNDDIELALGGYKRKVKELSACVLPPLTDEGRIQQAAMHSLAGADTSVLSDIDDALAKKHHAAARLLAISNRRLGDKRNSKLLLGKSADYWTLCAGMRPADGEAFLQLGQVQMQLADLERPG